jgi:ribonuclease J
MPIHGEYRMLVMHCELATDCGVPEQNTFVLENGDVLEMTAETARKNGRIKSGIILVDSSRAWHINDSIVAERRHLAEDGLVIVAVSLDAQHKVLVGPDVTLKGVILPRGLPIEEFIATVQAEARAILNNRSVVEKLEIRDLQAYLLGALNRFFAEKMRAKPLVQVLIQDVSNGDYSMIHKSIQSASERAASSENKCEPSTTRVVRIPNDPGAN